MIFKHKTYILIVTLLLVVDSQINVQSDLNLELDYYNQNYLGPICCLERFVDVVPKTKQCTVVSVKCVQTTKENISYFLLLRSLTLKFLTILLPLCPILASS